MDPFEFLRKIAVFQGFLRGPADNGRGWQRSGSVKLGTSHRPGFDAKHSIDLLILYQKVVICLAKPAISRSFLAHFRLRRRSDKLTRLCSDKLTQRFKAGGGAFSFQVVEGFTVWGR
jgi:hypothetical protein